MTIVDQKYTTAAASIDEITGHGAAKVATPDYTAPLRGTILLQGLHLRKGGIPLKSLLFLHLNCCSALLRGQRGC